MKLSLQRVLILALGIGVGLCLYLAWRPSPFLTEVSFIPSEFARWADSQYNLRTAIPFLGLGFVGALVARGSWAWLGRVLVGLFAFSALLEIGQLFIPSRNPNFEDVFFGAAGALIGAFVALPVFLWQRRFSGTEAPPRE